METALCRGNLGKRQPLWPRTKVRVNFQKKVYDNMGAVVCVEKDLNPETYQSFFGRVSKAIFFEEEKI